MDIEISQQELDAYIAYEKELAKLPKNNGYRESRIIIQNIGEAVLMSGNGELNEN